MDKALAIGLRTTRNSCDDVCIGFSPANFATINHGLLEDAGSGTAGSLKIFYVLDICSDIINESVENLSIKYNQKHRGDTS